MTRYIFLISAMGFTFFFAGAQNVGIGTVTPAAKLDIIGSVKITDGTQGANKILTSGSDGLASWSEPPAPACFFFATDLSTTNNSFLGLGSTSAGFIRNTIVVPFNCELTSIVFNTRGAIGTFTATVWKQSLNGTALATNLSTTVMLGSYFSIATGSVLLLQGDLISVQLSAGSATGPAVSITYK